MEEGLAIEYSTGSPEKRKGPPLREALSIHVASFVLLFENAFGSNILTGHTLHVVETLGKIVEVNLQNAGSLPGNGFNNCSQ